jgi:hypothetical protein
MREWVKYIRASVTTPSVYDKVYVFTQTRHLHGSDWQLEFKKKFSKKEEENFEFSWRLEFLFVLRIPFIVLASRYFKSIYERQMNNVQLAKYARKTISSNNVKKKLRGSLCSFRKPEG